MKKAFALVEIIIVVAILGILAAIALPSVQGYSTKARNAVTKDMLNTLRNQIELYKFNHKGQAPGFIGGNLTSPANTTNQFLYCTKENGELSPFKKKIGDYDCGPYFPKIPANPFNKLSTIIIVPDATDFSAAADGTSSGWLYKTATAEMRINSTGRDDNGIRLYEL